MTISLANGTYRPHKKRNDFLLYINTFSNHPPQKMKQLPTSINERPSKNVSREEIFNASKYEYKAVLINSGYQQTELIFFKKEQKSRN